jgi:hypothetical protein
MWSNLLYSCIIVLFISGCSGQEYDNCDLPCQLEIDQNTSLTVQDFINALVQKGWLQSTLSYRPYTAYARDTFSNVLETTTTIVNDGDLSPDIPSQVDLYIGYVGGISPDNENILSEQIENIRIFSDMTLFESVLIYGSPQGGQILPYFTEGDLAETNPCPNRSHYVAYYDNGKTIIRASIEHPLDENMWSTQVEIVYPIGEALEFSQLHIGHFDKMDHTPCLND